MGIEYDFISKLKSRKKFKDLIHNSDIYEKFLMDILNNSNFFKRLEHIPKDKQNDGEDDFKELNGEGKIIKTYEATLLTSSKIVESIFYNNGIPKEYINFIRSEIVKVYLNRLNKKKEKENIIIFNIYPIKENKIRESVFEIILNANDMWIQNYKKFLRENIDNKIKNLFIVSLNTNYRSKNNFYVKQILNDGEIVNKITFVDEFDLEKLPFQSYSKNINIKK